uniref:Calmodulin-binding domain-containing protein n=1 Tax=Anthurium amnicola TaxID=1678845 RepID=A0A1D1XKN8_9ARAE
MDEEQTEGVPLTVTPEMTNLKDVRRNSTGKVSATTSLSKSNSGGKISSRYLRASMGSCHDFCKYGGKHSFETKARSPLISRFSGSCTYLEKEQNQVNIPSVAERQKKSALKQKAVAHLKIGLYERPKVFDKKAVFSVKTVKPIRDSEIILHERGESSKELEVRCDFSLRSKEVESLEGLKTIKQDTLEKVGLCDETEIAAQKIPACLKKTEASRYCQNAYKRKPSVKKTQLSRKPSSVERTQSAKKPFTSFKPKIKQKTSSPVNKVNSSGNSKVSKQEASSPADRFDASARPAISGKSSITFPKSESQLKRTTGISGRVTGIKMVKKVDQSKPGGKKILRSPSFPSSPQPPVDHVSSSASPVKHAREDEKGELENDKIGEKTLYIIGPTPSENDNSESSQSKSCNCSISPSSPSSSSSSSLSPLSSSSFVSDHEEEEHLDSNSAFTDAFDSASDHSGERVNIAIKNEDEKGQRKVSIVHPECKDQTPYKLKFRRGKILNPEFEYGVTRRLRFRQGRGVGDNQSSKGEMGKITFNVKEFYGDSNDPDPEAEPVVLRHQDVQDKKDTTGLFNHVIEEAASKLVEVRKSKVKALVGAFETVISLQESKPAS